MADDIQAEWEELADEYKKLEETHQVYLNKQKEFLQSQSVCLAQIKHQRYRLKSIQKNFKSLKGSHDLKNIEEEAVKREAQLQLIEETLPKSGSRYLRVILGNVDVSFLSQDAKFKYKDDYEKFKLICHVIALVSLFLIMTTGYKIFEMLYFFFLVWYYCTLTIRESILRTNGSKIKMWWRIHHALSTVSSGIFLVWPENATWLEFKGQFFRYNIYNCFLQYLLFNYQEGALYRLRALGQKDNMEITLEGFQYWMWRGLTFLLPFLFIAYFYQLYNAYILYKLSFHPEATWHVAALGILMLVFFTGNSITTLLVVPNKIKNKMLVRYKTALSRLYGRIPKNNSDSKLNKDD
ncbi:transmembrane protein 120 homolog [Sitophilus oryzae]|uniref:Transmembrane protein 120 homolog n=1 Tax=Sitophilus oryzae TaxID=7048 RepID=A0A6J2YM54_SITOR|nr:transmembrane protein 120 homolog [Sitophilus oryzae]